MLPTLPPSIPVKSELFQFLSDLLDGRDVEFKPDPFSHYMGLAPQLWDLSFHAIKKCKRVLHACLIANHSYSLSAVRLRKQVASGWVTLAGSSDGIHFSEGPYSRLKAPQTVDDEISLRDIEKGLQSLETRV
jgi:hypothetical protein